jgi:hypothetical protein
MPILVAIQSITTSRDGRRVKVRPGDAFEFTDEEAGSLMALRPEVVRAPLYEAPPPAPPPVVEVAPVPAAQPAPATRSAARAGAATKGDEL